MKRIGQFELIDHGIENSQYFQGCGTAYTKFTDVATGIGDNPAEAIEDALDQLAQADWDVEDLAPRILAAEGWKEFPTEPSVGECYPIDDDGIVDFDGECDLYYHVSIRVSE